MDDIVKTALATALFKPEFICIDTFSGYRGSFRDPQVAHHIANLDATDNELDVYVVDALTRSRFVVPRRHHDVWIHPEATFDPVFFEKDTMSKNHADWFEDMMTRFNYKNRRVLFKDMHRVGIVSAKNTIEFNPSHHVKGDYWTGEGFTDADNIVIPFDSKTEQIGAALRLAFSRCTG